MMKRMIVSTVSLVIVAALALIVTGASAIAQETPTAPTANATLPPVSTPLPPSSVTPQDLPSLSGVGGTPLRSNVRIRVEPSLDADQMGIVRFGKFIDIVGTNGFDTSRSCAVDFESTLDMWVQVVYREQRGWVARCTLRVYGDMSRLPIEAEPEAVG